MSDKKRDGSPDLAEALEFLRSLPKSAMHGKLQLMETPQELQHMSNALLDRRHSELCGMLQTLAEKVDALSVALTPRNSPVITMNCNISGAEDIARIVAELEKMKGGAV